MRILIAFVLLISMVTHPPLNVEEVLIKSFFAIALILWKVANP